MTKTVGQRVADKWWPGTNPDEDDIKERLAELIDEEVSKDSVKNQPKTDTSWDSNPDRSGGQFTQEEINRAKEWR